MKIQAWLVLTAASADMDTIATADGLYRYVSPASRRLFEWDPTGLSFLVVYHAIRRAA